MNLLRLNLYVTLEQFNLYFDDVLCSERSCISLSFYLIVVDVTG